MSMIESAASCSARRLVFAEQRDDIPPSAASDGVVPSAKTPITSAPAPIVSAAAALASIP